MSNEHAEQSPAEWTDERTGDAVDGRPDDGGEGGSAMGTVSRRAFLRSGAAAAALPFAATAGARDTVDETPGPTDEPLPGPTVAPMGFDCGEDQTGDYTTVSREPTHEFGREEVVELDSAADGEKVQLGYILPEPKGDRPDGDYPVILRATPYVSDLRKPDSIRDCVRIERLTENFVQQGYAVAVVAVRGTGGSGGCMELFGATEQADVDQAVTYLGTQEWSNGNVGIVGRSYDGSTPWMPARLGNPHLATVVPYSGVADIFELMYKRGAPESRGYGVLPALYYVISLAEHAPTSGTGLATYLSRAQCPDNYAAGTAWSVYSGATGEYDPSGYWAERVLKPGVARNYDGSILMVHGLQDWNVDPSQIYPWVDALQAAGIKTHLYLGQFGHRYPDDARQKGEPTYNEQWQDYLLAWFESELKGESYEGEFTEAEGIPEGSYDPVPAVYAQNSADEWYTAESWPPEAADSRTLYLGSDGDIRDSPDPETAEGRVSTDGSAVEPGARGTVTFKSEPLDERLRIAGAPTLSATVTPTSSAPHLTVHLFTVDSEGAATRLGWGQVDLRYASDGPEADTVVPGEPLSVSLPVEPLDAVVPAGESLAVVLNQGTVSGRVESPTPTPVLVETGGDAALSVEAWGADLGTTGTPSASGRRTSDGTAVPGGRTVHQQLTVSADPAAPVRDTVPASWTVLAEDSEDVARTETDDEADVTHVHFTSAATEGTTLSYFVETPSDPGDGGRYRVGPAAVRREGDWLPLDGTRADAVVLPDPR